MELGSLEHFEEGLLKRRYFLYLPYNIMFGLRNSAFEEVEFGFAGLANENKWSGLPKPVQELFSYFVRRCRGDAPFRLLAPDLEDDYLWNKIYGEIFDPKVRHGHHLLSDGSVIEFISSEIRFGTFHSLRGTESLEFNDEEGHIVIVKTRYTSARLTKLMRRAREHLHTIRRNDPVKIIEVATSLGLL